MLHRDDTASRMGMWLFLFTELMLFGTLFIIYAVFRTFYGDAFAAASAHLDRTMGTLNTVILLVSSLTMGISTVALKKGKVNLSMAWLGGTMALATWFFINKMFEWGGKISHGIYPGSELLESLSKGEVLFYGLYYVMTGIHGFHIVLGVIVLGVMMYFIKTGHQNPDRHAAYENVGLYWHIVDLMWGFLFPLFYLIS